MTCDVDIQAQYGERQDEPGHYLGQTSFRLTPSHTHAPSEDRLL